MTINSSTATMQRHLSFYPSGSEAQPGAQRTVSFLLFEALRQNCIFFLGSLQPDVRLFVNYLGSFFWDLRSASKVVPALLGSLRTP